MRLCSLEATWPDSLTTRQVRQIGIRNLVGATSQAWERTPARLRAVWLLTGYSRPQVPHSRHSATAASQAVRAAIRHLREQYRWRPLWSGLSVNAAPQWTHVPSATASARLQPQMTRAAQHRARRVVHGQVIGSTARGAPRLPLADGTALVAPRRVVQRQPLGLGIPTLLVHPLAAGTPGGRGEPSDGTHREPDGGGVTGPHGDAEASVRRFALRSLAPVGPLTGRDASCIQCRP